MPMKNPLTAPTPDPVTEQLIAIYDSMDAIVRERLVWATRQYIQGDWDLQRAAMIKAQIAETMALLGATVDNLEGNALNTVWSLGTADAIAELTAMGVPEARLQSAMFNPAAVESLARDLAKTRGEYLGTISGGKGSILRQVDDYLRRLSANELTQGVVLGDQPYLVGMRIREAAINEQRLQVLAGEIDRVGTVPYFDKDGNELGRHSLHSYGQMASRTGLARAREEGNMAVHEAAGIEVFQINKTGTLCYICRPFEGQTFRYDWSTSPEYQRFPLLPREAPFHPNCYHRRVPVSYPDDLEAMSADELETLGRDNRGLYAYMRDEMPQGKELMWAARHGFATEAQQRTYRRMAHQVGMPEKDLRGPRWRYAGIESRRPEAIGRMIMDPRLRYKDAMASETQAFMRSPSYKKQRPKSLTPAAQRRAVAAMLREERAAARMAR